MENQQYITAGTISSNTVVYSAYRPKFCSECGRKLESDWNNCPGCGRVIVATWPTYPYTWTIPYYGGIYPCGPVTVTYMSGDGTSNTTLNY